jgi:hypothetical protein
VEIPYTKLGRKVVYRKTDLDRFLARNTHDAETVLA